MSDGTPVIDAVLCNFNQAQWLPISLCQLNRQSIHCRRIHVVDNASTDQSIHFLNSAKQISPIPLVIHRLAENLGGSGGFALGINTAMRDSPDFVLLLDGDAFLDERTVEKLLHRARTRNDVAVVGPKIYFAPRKTGNRDEITSGRIVQEIGGKLDWERADFVLCHRGRDENTSSEITGVFSVDYVAACTCLVRQEAIVRCGTMDPSFFLYWDDIDWCTRMRTAGYRIEALANAVAWHVGGGRVRTSLIPTYFHWRNKIRFFGRHRGKNPEARSLEKALFQGFRAAFTCRLFGQSMTAEIIEKALEHGWLDRSGPLEMPAEKLPIETVQRRIEPQKENDGFHWIDGLDHVLELPEDSAGLDPDRTVLRDQFGKEMRLADARSAREEFLQWYPERLIRLQKLPGAWK